MSTTAAPSIEELNETLTNFKDDRFAAAQASNAEKDLARFDGQNIESFRRGIELVRDLPIDHFSLLDIGCGIGMYGVLMREYVNKKITYSGGDFSPAMVRTAQRLNPGCIFRETDARNLPFEGKSVDVVWISALLEHVPEFETVLAEAVRVGRKYLLLHRLFLHDGPTERQILTTKANEYPYEGFSYPRTMRNAAEFDAAIQKFGAIEVRQPWTFDQSKKQNLCLYSYRVRLA
jgi:SAM-dependent methyltransferase